jgi:hypothetical protein
VFSIASAARFSRIQLLGHAGVMESGTGPLFLIAGILLLSSNLTHGKPISIWTGVIVGTGAAFFLEWRYARKLSADACNS